MFAHNFRADFVEFGGSYTNPHGCPHGIQHAAHYGAGGAQAS
jgi:hypothetical protein